MRCISVAIMFLFVGTVSALAGMEERFAPFYYDRDDPKSILLLGEIDSRTPLAFSRLIETLPSADSLVLSSPGGNVYAAILVAREVNRLGMTTVIPEGEDCFSACSFIYFAGHERFSFGKLGIHQISSNSPDLIAAQLAVSDISELLDEFAVPNDVFLLMLRTPPERMHILSPAELGRLGLIGTRQSTTAAQNSGEGARQDVPQQELSAAPDFSLAEGAYSSGGLKVVIDSGLVGITYTGQGCIGSFDAKMQEQSGRISFVGVGCTIGVTKLGPFDFSMDQGPGCSYYHGSACSLSGYVRRSN